jgi:peptidoglycan/LPS O-acetylase OafA/YrhL
MTANRLLSPHLKYRSDIDGLRAVAVIAVVAFHAFPGAFKGGFIGVDIFFVISGFLISTIIYADLEDGSFSFARFYARRIRRLIPSLVLVLGACYAFGWFALFADEYRQLGAHLAGGAGFVANFVFWKEAGYFDTSSETKPLLHLWSLGIEEQFYILWPVLLWVFWKRNLNTLSLTLIVAIVSFWLNIKGVRRDPAATFYSPQTRFWELLCGGLLAWTLIFVRDAHSRIRTKFYERISAFVFRNPPAIDQSLPSNIESIVGSGLIICGFVLITREAAFPGAWALLPVCGAALMISAGPTAWLNRTVLSHPLMVWFGLISYPLYLWHWPILSFARIVQSGEVSAGVRLGLVLFAVILAWLSYRFVEIPIRFGRFGSQKALSLAAVLGTIGIVGYATLELEGLKARSANVQVASIKAEFVGPFWQYVSNPACKTRYPLEGSDKYGWWFCIVSSAEKPTLLLLGDSYANHLYPGIVGNENLKHQTVLSIGTCDAGWIERSELVGGELTYSPCSGFRRHDQLQFIDGIILKERSIKYAIIAGINAQPDADYIDRLRKRIEFLERNHIKVILVAPHLKAPYHTKGCYSRPFAATQYSCEISLAEYQTISQSFKLLVDSIQASNPNVLAFDQNVLFCSERGCSYKVDGLPAFRDEYSHLSEYASRKLSEKFVEWSRTNLPELLQ